MAQLVPTDSLSEPHTLRYYQQTASPALNCAIVFSSLLSIAAVLLFSWVRRKRGSIYGSRQFFMREEHRAEPLSDGFFGWIEGLVFFERKVKQQQRLNSNESADEVNRTSGNGGASAAPLQPFHTREAGTSSLTNNKGGFWGRLHKGSVDANDASQEVARTNKEGTVQGEKAPGSQTGMQASVPPATSNLSEASNTSSQSPQPHQTDAEERAQQAVIAKIGLDHYLLIRFLKMLLTLSIIIAILAVGALVPLYSAGQYGEEVLSGIDVVPHVKRVEMLHIGNVTDNERLWATVMVTIIFSAVIILWAWSELMMFLKLRQDYLIRAASRYSSRVVLLQNLPPTLRSVSALKETFKAAPGGGVEYVYLVRDMTALEKAVKRRQVALDRLEETESRYMDAIARASAMVSTMTLSMRSRSWIGRALDHFKACFGHGSTHAGTSKSSDEEEYVGHLKLYQLGDVLPKLSLSDLSGSSPTGSRHAGGDGAGLNSGENSTVSSSASGLAVLKWYQKPRRPRHYVGWPLISKRQDSIRYYRGEVCRLNKEIAQAYQEQVQAMAADMQSPGKSGTGQPSPLRQARAMARSLISEAPAATFAAVSESTAHNTDPIDVLPSAFVLMRTRAGAKAVAHAALENDHYSSVQRLLGIPPRDIEWEVVGQTQSRTAKLMSRAAIFGAGSIVCVGSGFAVSAIASMVVHQGWRRVSEEEVDIPTATGAYLVQGVLAPLLLSILMFAGSWVVNVLSRYWRQVCKTQTELLSLRFYFAFLAINMIVVHPILLLTFSWQESAALGVDTLVDFLAHALPSYCSFVATYTLVFGLSLPLYHLLQLPRLWATLPAITLWSALGPLSWRKSTRSSHPSSKDGQQNRNSGENHASDQRASSISSLSTTSAFEANFAPAPTQTPRQAFQIRQPPFLSLQSVYPHMGLLFALSLAMAPMAPVLILLWIFVLIISNLCYRHLVFQVVTTKSQSGGLHYLQAIKFTLFPTLACPPLLLVVYMVSRQAWIQAGFAVVMLLAVLAMRVLVGVQFRKREESMLKRVEKRLVDPKTRLLHGMASGVSQGSAASGLKTLQGEGAQPTSQMLSTTKDGSAASLSHLSPSFVSDEGDEEDGDEDTHEYEASNDLPRGGRRRIKRMMQRPTTIIGQVRSSLASSMSAGGSRPKSVPLFDLDRYEKEIMGMGFAPENKLPSTEELEGLEDGQMGESRTSGTGAASISFPPGVHMPRENTHSRNPSLARAYTTATGGHADRSSSSSFGPGYGVSDIVEGFFTDNPGRRAMVTKSILSKAEEEEEIKEAKYREIVKALRRASSVASRKMPELMASNDRSEYGAAGAQQQRRVRVAGPAALSFNGLETVQESEVTGQFSRRALPSPGGGRGTLASAATKAKNRASLPALLNPRPVNGSNNSPQLAWQRNKKDACSNVSASSEMSARAMFGRGAPSLPVLLIHRETAVVAKENSRIQGLYLNPVLQEAKARVVVWLPSQTELSFLGASGKDGALFGRCRYHSSKANGPAASSAATQFGSESNLVLPMTGTESESSSPSHDRSTFGQSTSTLAPLDIAATQQSPGRNKYPCTCHLYQEVMKAVADAVALADQEIRDLRIVGLTVWLDSRHVVWGEEGEEDGRLGDRVMMSTGSAALLGGFDGFETTAAVAAGAGSFIGQESAMQKQVGDGLLSWLELDEDGNDQSCPGQGAVGIIGGSMGVIMKRPIGCYGKLVGDGEEGDYSKGSVE
ncbi:hypothetical protein BGZ72_005395 [Mortierella alpina]|nr:hypothetical protein BGZ72_005395 [Mortierella alpina]